MSGRKPMRIHYIQHVPFETPGRIETWARAQGHEFTGSHLYKFDQLPEVDAFDWLVVMGGPMGAYDEARFPWMAAEKRLIVQAVDRGRRVLGICLGAQLMAAVLGAYFSSPSK